MVPAKALVCFHHFDFSERGDVVRTVRDYRHWIASRISALELGLYKPTYVDICTYIGTFRLFFTCFLLFIRFLPMIAISEVKGVTPQADPHHPAAGQSGGGCAG
jgi:hypothetical protein